MRQQESYWTYKAPPTPELHDLPSGTFGGTEAGWSSLSPGMRREIWRSATKRAASQQVATSEDVDRLQRADRKHHQGEVQIASREVL